MNYEIKLKDTELVMIIPNSICGEVGEDVSNQLRAIVKAMVAAWYCPLYFGENSGEWTELWVESCNSLEEAEINAELFFESNGAYWDPSGQPSPPRTT